MPCRLRPISSGCTTTATGLATATAVRPPRRGVLGHRHDILAPFTTPVVMGAALGMGSYGPSMTELFVGGDRTTDPGESDAPMVPDWAEIRETCRSRSVHAGAARGGGVGGEDRVSASGEAMVVGASVLPGGHGWSVRPRSCRIAAGASRHVDGPRRAGAAGAAVPVAGPNGTRRVTLTR